MNDEKFDEIMKDWTTHEMESTPQLRPKKEMYQMVKAKKQKVFFPLFVRWATVGAAAVFIIALAILHPDFFRSTTQFDQSPRQQEPSEILEREEHAIAMEELKIEKMLKGRKKKATKKRRK